MNASPRYAPLLPAGTTADQSQSQPIDCRAYLYHTVYFKSAGTTSGGTITIEEADWDGPAGQPPGGTWSIIGTATNASGFTGGNILAVHLPVGAYGWIRVRVSAAITGGGSISASLRSVQP